MNLSKKRTNRTYDLSFKEDVIAMIASGRPISELSTSLGISGSLLRRWYKVSQSNTSSSHRKGVQTSPGQTDFREENERLKIELRRTEQERDILKKALGIFSRAI